MSKKYTSVVLIVLFILLIGGFFVWKKSPTATAPVNQPTSVSQQNTPPTQVTPTPNAGAPIRYENKKYGFSLALPKEWKDYKEVYLRDGYKLCEDAYYSCVAEIHLLIPTNDPHYFYNPGTGESDKVSGYGQVLTITVVDSKQWDKSFSSPNCKKNPLDNIYCPQRMLPNVAGKNNQYVFFINGGINAGGDPNSWPDELKNSENVSGFFQNGFSVISAQK